MRPSAGVAALIAPALLATRARAQTGTSAWLLRATRLQHYLTYEHTVQTIPLTATHNSYSSDYDPRTRAYFEVQANQIFDIPTQLRCLGTRGFEIDVHWLGSQAASDADASGLRVCHAGRGAAIYAYQLCTEMGWKKCNECGVEDFGPQSTICRRDAPTFGEVLQGIADWLDDPANAQEFLSVKLETRMNSPPGLLSQEIARVVGADRVYSAQDLEDDGGEWPTVASAVARGKQILFQSLNEVGALVLAYTEFAIKPAQIVDLCTASGPLCDDALYRGAENTTSSASSGLSLSDSGSPPDTICFRDVYRVQGDATALQFDAGGQTVFEYAFPPEDFLSAELVRPAQLCAFVPTFDRIDAALLASTVWSWAEGAPAVALPPPNTCAYVSAADGRWQDEPCRGGAARVHACVGGGGRGVWTVTAAGGAGDARAVACGGGARFGAPRDAQENAALAQAMMDAGVAEAWINVRTNAQGCWAAEGGRAYCVANGLVGSIPDETTCGAAPPPVPQQQREVCTNLDVPWNEFSYAAPSFSAPIAAEQMHEWPRVYGGNTWVLQPWYFRGCAYISIPFVCVGILVVVAMVAVEWHRSWRCCRRRGCCYAARGGSAAAAADAAKPRVGSGANGPNKTVAEPGNINAGPGLDKPDPGSSKSGAGAGFEAEERRRSHAALLFAACCLVTFGASVVAVVGSAGANHQLVEVQTELDMVAHMLIDARDTAIGLDAALNATLATAAALAVCDARAQAAVEAGALDQVDALAAIAHGALQAFVRADTAALGADVLHYGDVLRSIQIARIALGIVCSAAILAIAVAYIVLSAWVARAVRGGDTRLAVKRARYALRLNRRLMLPLAATLVMLAWIMAGGYAAGGFIVSDLCVNPRQSIANALPRTVGTIAAHYMECDGPTPELQRVMQGYLVLRTAEEVLTRFDCPVPAKAEALRGLDGLASGVGSLLSDTRCATINPVYVAFEDAICTDATPYILTAWVGALLVGIFLAATVMIFTLLLRRTLQEECAKLGLDVSAAAALSPLSRNGGGSGSEDFKPAQKAPAHARWWHVKPFWRTAPPAAAVPSDGQPAFMS